MKKIITILMVQCLLAGLFYSCDTTPKGNGQNEIYIVADVSLSGGKVKYGEQVWNGLLLSKDTLESLGVKIIREDNKSSENSTKQKFNLYADRNDVLLVLTNNSPLSKAARQDAENAEITQIAMVAGDVELCFNKERGEYYQWVFRDAIMQDQEAAVFAPVILSDSSIKTISMLGVSDGYGTEGMSYLEKEIQQRNPNINIIKATFNNNTEDFNTMIEDQLRSNPDAFYFAGRESNINAYVKQLRKKLMKNGLDKPIYVCDAFDDEDVLNSLQDYAKGVVFASYFNDFDNPEGQAFLKLYRDTYEKNPGIYAVDAYVCGQYIVKLVSEGNRTTEAFNKAMETMTFDSPIKGHLQVVNHSVISNVALYRINEKGEKELVYKPELSISEE